MEPSMQITLTVPANADNASIAAALRMRAGIFEGMDAKTAASRKNTDSKKTTATATAATLEDDTDTDGDEEFETEAPVKTTKKTTATKKAAATLEDDGDEEGMEAETETTDESEIEEDEDFSEPAPKKSAKATKVTIAQVNDACKAKARAAKAAGKNGRDEVLKILKKKFGTDATSQIKPDQYAAVIKAMAV